MNQILAFVRLELALFFRDRRALLLVFAVPIAVASFLGVMTGGSGLGKGQGGLQLLVTDLDHSAISRGVVSNFVSDPTFRVTVTNEDTARGLVLEGKRPVAIVIRGGFGANALPGLFDTNRKPAITLYHDPSHATERQLVEGMLVPKVLQSVVENAVTWNAARERIRAGLDRIERDGNGLSERDRVLYREMLERTDAWLASRADRSEGESTGNGAAPAGPKEFPLPFRIDARAMVRKQAVYNAYAHSFAGMGVQFVLMAMIDLAVGLIRERESGVFRRLRSIPLSRATMLAGKGLAWSLVSMLSLAGCFAFAWLVFDVRITGSFLGFLSVIVACGWLAASLGLLLAALGRTAAGTRGLSILVILLMVMIGGAWVPAFIFPQWLQTLSMATPTRWAIDGFDAATWRGLGPMASLVPAAVISGFAAVFATIAWLRFRWDAE